ncbi:MAG: tRNA guanosine(34) transglycosylase Tgt, partial [Parvibaculales bacterium]
KCNEYLGPMLLSWNNLHYYQQLMGGLRAAIEAGKISEFIDDFERAQAAGDLSPLD